jgi:ABC transport system ATP-binding/permease protein
MSAMNPLLSCQSVSKSYGATPLFSDISLTINEGERLGLIGPNGSGKSTLLKILSGLLDPDQGELSLARDSRVIYLPQEELPDSEKTVEQVLMEGLESLDMEDRDRFSAVKKWMGRALFQDGDAVVSSLSGGWKKRLSIVTALIGEPELLLLDEPTNHLDIEGICWLEDILRQPEFGFVLVTHDRYFLENVTRRIVELNSKFPKGIIKVEAPYSEFIIRREAELDNQLQLESVLANKVKRETEWLRRGPKARTTKARFRIEEAYKLREEYASVHRRNVEGKSVGFDFDGTHRKTKRLLAAENLGKSLGGRKLFANLNLLLTPGTCLGLLGKNGTGKSTLLSVLAGELEPDTGEVRWAIDVKNVIFDQSREQLDQTQTLKESLAPESDSVIYRGRSVHVVSWAKRMLFEAEALELPISQLSGGEQARILIANLMLRPADILFLDEPTNDLDIPSLEVLEAAIKDFPGAVVLVTHDRFLLDRLTTSVIGFDGSGNAQQFADYNQWLSSLSVKKKKSGDKVSKPKTVTSKLTYKEQTELGKMEEKILTGEQEVEKLQEQAQNPDIMNDTTRLQECCSLLQTAQEKVETLYARWEELETIRSNQLQP